MQHVCSYACVCTNSCFIGPSKPMNIRFHTTNVSIFVQWDAIINQHVDRYIVNWTDGTNPIQSVIAHKISYTVTGLTPNTTYIVTVAAVNKCGTSADSSSVRTNVSSIHGVTPTVTINTITTISVFYPTATMNTTNPTNKSK